MIPKLRVPIVLVHGLLGFDRICLGGITLARYFPGIHEGLQNAGNRVLVPWLSPTKGVAERAQQLKTYILRHSPKEPVHIVAHSMGGLDARYMISCLGMERHVLSLTTLGTPHRGTCFADWGISRLERVIKPIMHFFGLSTQAFYDLTISGCRAFNEKVRDVPHVRYFSVAGKHDGNLYNPEFLIPYHIVLEREGPNDGVVSVASAQYGEHCDIWDGDHLSLVNWLNPMAHRSFSEERYRPLFGRLAEMGM